MDALLLATQLTLTAADWSQTRDLARHPNIVETCPVLGQHPDAGRINRYFIFYEATVVGLSYEWQPAIGVSAAIEAGVVAHNASIGLRVRF